MRGRRTVKKTGLVVCEGMHDAMFMRLLKMYYEDHSKVDVSIKKGCGGSQVDIVRLAINSVGDYDNKCIIMDNDRPSEEMRKAERLAKEHGIIVYRNSPCLERMLVSILEPKKDMGKLNSRQIKSYFQDQYIPEEKRTSLDVCSRKFSKDLLDERRSLSDLDRLIEIFES